MVTLILPLSTTRESNQSDSHSYTNFYTNQASRIVRLNVLCQKPPFHSKLAQRSFCETRQCNLPSKGSGRRHPKAPRRQRPQGDRDKKRRSGGESSTNLWGNRTSHQQNAGGRTNATSYSTKNKIFSIQRERNKAVLCLASNWTKPAPRPSRHPAVLDALNGLQGR